ncbi:transmembrane protein 218-like [Centruroides sculpturatus]|uniref:transmembrane protein 218-like n=1 Tax=Centruroides sculpturatus TaxID=218467 RepID=UPI000C6DF89B|nr:transmembrane protein 218-like [Centruroides sculpturatus]
MALILGIGIGLFILILMWTLTIASCIIVAKTKGFGYIATSAFVASSFVTTLLIWIPREPPTYDSRSDIRIYDSLFIWRIILIIIMTLSCVFAFSNVLSYLMEPIFAKRIKGSDKWTSNNN